MCGNLRFPIGLLAIVLLASCEEAANVRAGGDSETAQAPSTIVGRVVVLHFNGEVLRGDPRCQANNQNPRTARLWFIDENTIRAVRNDGTFDQPSRRWEYEVTGARSGTIEIWWANGSYNGFDLTFTGDTSGTLRVEQQTVRPDRCGNTHTLITGEFELEDPPISYEVRTDHRRRDDDMGTGRVFGIRFNTR